MSTHSAATLNLKKFRFRFFFYSQLYFFSFLLMKRVIEMLNGNVWEEGVSWEHRCRCIQVQKDELSKKVHGLEDALRQARTRCEHLETLVKQAARRHLLQQSQSMSLDDIKLNDENFFPTDATAVGSNFQSINYYHKYTRDEQDFIRELQKRNVTLQQNSNKIHQKLKSAIQVIKKYKKDVNTLRLRIDSTKRRHTHTSMNLHGGRQVSACKKSVDYYHDLESDVDDDFINEKENGPTLSREQVMNTLESKITVSTENEKILNELLQTKAAYQLLQTQYSVLDSKMGNQCEIQKQLITKLDESNEYVERLQKEIEILKREKSSREKSVLIQTEFMEDEIQRLRVDNTILKEKSINVTNMTIASKNQEQLGIVATFIDTKPTVSEHSELIGQSKDVKLQQEFHILREQSMEDQRLMTELQSKLDESLGRIEELSVTVQQMTTALTASQKNKDLEDSNHRKAASDLELALSAQTLAFESLEREMKEKDLELQITLTQLKGIIEQLEVTCAQQREQIIQLTESDMTTNKNDLFHAKEEERREEELPLMACEFFDLHADLNPSVDLMTRVNKFENMCKGGCLKIHIIEAKLSSYCMFKNRDTFTVSTFVVVDFLDFTSQASRIACGENPVYNFESTFHLQMSAINALVRNLYTTTMDDFEMQDKRKRKQNSNQTLTRRQTILSVEIYYVTERNSIRLIAKAYPCIDLWNISRAQETNQGLALQQYTLFSPTDYTTPVGSIQLGLNFICDNILDKAS